MYLDAIFYFVVLMAIFAVSDIISTAHCNKSNYPVDVYAFGAVCHPVLG